MSLNPDKKETKYIEKMKFFEIQNFPFIADTFDQMTYYELLCKVVEMVDILRVNSNNLVYNDNELYKSYDDLKTYVNNYFDNLDIQEEVNNKLDEMLENGQLEELILQVLTLQGLLCYNNKNDLRNATNLIDGSFAYTYGELNYKDGFSYFYKIREIENTDVIDNVKILALNNFQNLVAERIENNKIYHFYFHEGESIERLEKLLDLDYFKIIEFDKNGTYEFNETLRMKGNVILELNNSNLIFNVPKASENAYLSHGFFNFKSSDIFTSYNGNSNITIRNGKITKGNCSFIHAQNINFENLYFETCNNDHILEMCAISDLNIKNCIFNGICANENNFKECVQFDCATYNNFPFLENLNNFDDTPCKNILIENCKFLQPETEGYTMDVSIGMHSFVENVFHENIKIINNSFENPKNMSIQLFNSKNVNIENNYFYANNEDVITNEGSHIRTRNSYNNFVIKNNNFFGNYRAIENASPHNANANNNLVIDNNTFDNYLSNVENLAIISIRDNNFCEITNNLFTNFNLNCIRTNQRISESNNNYNISNNKFITSESIPQGAECIKAYDGKAYINNNIFDITNIVTNNAGVIRFSNDLRDVFISNNVYNAYLSNNNHMIDSSNYSKSLKNVFCRKRGYTGNSTSLTSETLENNLDFTNFKHMIITLGVGAATYSVFLSAWANPLQEFLDARTYYIPVENGVVKLVLNSDKTISYDSNGTNIPIRNLSFIND